MTAENILLLVQAIIAGGFAVGMVILSARTGQINAMGAQRLAELEVRFIDRLTVMETAMNEKVGKVHSRVDDLAVSVSRIEGKLSNGATMRKEAR